MARSHARPNGAVVIATVVAEVPLAIRLVTALIGHPSMDDGVSRAFLGFFLSIAGWLRGLFLPLAASLHIVDWPLPGAGVLEWTTVFSIALLLVLGMGVAYLVGKGS